MISLRSPLSSSLALASRRLSSPVDLASDFWNSQYRTLSFFTFRSTFHVEIRQMNHCVRLLLLFTPSLAALGLLGIAFATNWWIIALEKVRNAFLLFVDDHQRRFSFFFSIFRMRTPSISVRTPIASSRRWLAFRSLVVSSPNASPIETSKFSPRIRSTFVPSWRAKKTWNWPMKIAPPTNFCVRRVWRLFAHWHVVLIDDNDAIALSIARTKVTKFPAMNRRPDENSFNAQRVSKSVPMGKRVIGKMNKLAVSSAEKTSGRRSRALIISDGVANCIDEADEKNCNADKCQENKRVFCPREGQCARRESSKRWELFSRTKYVLNCVSLFRSDVTESSTVPITRMKKIVTSAKAIPRSFRAIRNVRLEIIGEKTRPSTTFSSRSPRKISMRWNRSLFGFAWWNQLRRLCNHCESST